MPGCLSILAKEHWRLVKPFYKNQYVLSDQRSVRRYSVHNFSIANAIATLPRQNDKALDSDELQDLLSQCNLVPYENAMWLDSNRTKLIHYFPHIVSQRERPLILEEFETMERFLWRKYSEAPKAKKGRPGATEVRHANYEMERERMKELGLAVGTFRITVHQETGHQSSPAGFSDDFLGGTVEQTLLQTSFRSSPAISRLSAFISTLYAAIDPKSYRQYRDAYIQMTTDLPVLENLDQGNPMQCFAGYYLVLNLQTLLHRDCLDPRNGWVAMAVFGDYEGGELYLPDLGIRLPYKSGDVVFIRSWALRHCVSPFKGARYVIVFSTPFGTMKTWSEQYEDNVVYPFDDLVV
jgi:hypothetical protein